MPQIESDTPRRERSMPVREFMRTSDEACEPTWSTWPEMQERAIQDGTGEFRAIWTNLQIFGSDSPGSDYFWDTYAEQNIPQ